VDGPALDDGAGRPHAAARQVSATSAALDAIRASDAAFGMPQRSAAAARRHRASRRLTGVVLVDPHRAVIHAAGCRVAMVLRIRANEMTPRPRRATLEPATRPRPEHRPIRRQATR
jgi:hypothetical protein